MSNKSSMPLLGVGLLLVVAVAGAGAVLQRLTVYSGPNQTGSAVRVDEKIADLGRYPRLQSFLSSVQSYCAVGWFDFYAQCDFNGASVDLGGQGMDGATEKCAPANLSGFTGSVRFTGPFDLSTPVLTLIQGTSSNAFGGREIDVYERARRWIPLNQTSAVYTYGGSNWTLFTGDNFQGSSWCFQQTQQGKMINHLVLNATTHIRSVRQGCEGDSGANDAAGPGGCGRRPNRLW